MKNIISAAALIVAFSAAIAGIAGLGAWAAGEPMTHGLAILVACGVVAVLAFTLAQVRRAWRYYLNRRRPRR